MFFSSFKFSLEHAITRMTKGEHSQINLKSKALIGLDKFQIPKTAHVEYRITLNNFEKVCAQIESRMKKHIFLLVSRASTNGQ